MSGFQVASIDDIPMRDTWIPIREHLGIAGLGVNAYRGDEGATIVGDHTENVSQQVQLYYVIDGRATIAVGGEHLDAPAGTLVAITDPAVRRGASASAAATTLLVASGRAGQAYEESPLDNGHGDDDPGGGPGGYAVARLDEITRITDGRCPWRAVRHHFGILAFGANVWTAETDGARIINEHDEVEDGADEELYLVLSGTVRFELDDEPVDAPAGTLVFVKPGVKRTAFGESAGASLLALGAPAGRPYQSFGWEVWAPFQPLYEAGKYAEVADAARTIVETPPRYPDSLYNLACCEALAGRPADALAHLRESIELADRLKSFADGDSDFDSLRDDPGFKAIVAS